MTVRGTQETQTPNISFKGMNTSLVTSRDENHDQTDEISEARSGNLKAKTPYRIAWKRATGCSKANR
jgi:hypothetical protein